METGLSTLAKLIGDFEALDEVNYRLALVKAESEWLVVAGVVDNLSDAGRPRWESYDYGRVPFVAGVNRGPRMAEWISQLKGSTADYNFQIPLLQSQFTWWRYPSHTRHGYIGAGIPFTNYQVGAMQTRPQEPNNLGFLVSDISPFFPDFQTAVYTLLFDTTDRNQSGQLPNEVISVRLAHRGAWIESVHFTPTSVRLGILGDEVAGTRLQFSGSAEIQFDKSLEKPGDIDCLIPNGLPPNLWIVLSRGQTVLDYRNVVPGAAYAPTVDNMTIEVDSRTRIEELIFRGESEVVEFKREIPTDHDKFLKTIAAFANARGGTILVGVPDDDPQSIVGVRPPIPREKDRIFDMIRHAIIPEPQVGIEEAEIDGKVILAVHVEAGTQRPYALHPERPAFYVRRGANPFIARQDEIRALSLADTAWQRTDRLRRVM